MKKSKLIDTLSNMLLMTHQVALFAKPESKNSSIYQIIYFDTLDDMFRFQDQDPSTGIFIFIDNDSLKISEKIGSVSKQVNTSIGKFNIYYN